jgi:DHA2 family multidrug resistance protein
MGYMAIPIVAGPTLGPTVGGFIVSYLDWRLIFFLNLPVGILSVLVGAALLRDEREDRRPLLDVWGAVLASAGFGTILFGLSRVASDGWASLTVEGLVFFGAVCLILLVVHELEVERPLLEFRLFAIPQFLIGNVVGWTSTIALFGGQFLLPLYLQNLRGLSAFDTGLLLLPQGLSTAVMGPIAGRLTDRFGVRIVAVLGFTLLAVNTWNLMHITLDTDYNELRLLLVLRGLAVGCTMQSSNLVSLASVPARFLTNASSLNTAMRNVIQSFGIGLLGVLLQTQTVAYTAVLSQEVTATSEGGLFMQRAAAGLMQATPGLSMAAAQVQARMMMLSQVAREGAVLAFGDAYRFTFFSALLAIVLSMFLPMRRPTSRAVVVARDEGLAAAD